MRHDADVQGRVVVGDSYFGLLGRGGALLGLALNESTESDRPGPHVFGQQAVQSHGFPSVRAHSVRAHLIGLRSCKYGQSKQAQQGPHQNRGFARGSR